MFGTSRTPTQDNIRERHATQCDQCGENVAVARMTVTDLDGTLLDQAIYCVECLGAAIRDTGLEPGEVSND